MLSANKLPRFLFYWIPVLTFMSLIFLASSRPRIPVSENYVISFIIFKSLHLIEYAVLCFLLFRAFDGTYPKMSTQKKLLYAFLIAVLYGATDEFHQSLVPTREARLRDVFIDAIGAYVMYSYIKTYKHKIPRLLL